MEEQKDSLVLFRDSVDTDVVLIEEAEFTVRELLSDTASVLSEEIDASVGLEGTPLPYRLSMDDGITALLFFCFFLTAYVLTKEKKILYQQAKDYFFVKERSSMFIDSTLADVRYCLFLLLQTCILTGICFFDFFQELKPELIIYSPSYKLVGIYITICIIYYTLKWLIYSYVVVIFVDKIRGGILIDSYFFIISCLGLGLFPVTLLAVYFDLSFQWFVPLVLLIVILSKILLFYKAVKLFLDKFYGLFSIIMYFCALELMPCFILFQALVRINNLLLIKL